MIAAEHLKGYLMPTPAAGHPANDVPGQVARVRGLMAGYGPTWCLCGGWGVDAWLGRKTRDHLDVDIVVFQADLPALLDHLSGWQLVAHDSQVDDDTSEAWDGRLLAVPAHIHARLAATGGHLPERLDTPAESGFDLDIQVNEVSGDDWLLARAPEIKLPLRDSIRSSGWALPRWFRKSSSSSRLSTPAYATTWTSMPCFPTSRPSNAPGSEKPSHVGNPTTPG